MRSLYWKLGSALLLIVLVSVGLTAYLANVSTGREFRAYVQQGATMYARNVALTLGQSYADNRGWSGVQETLSALLRSPADRLVVADSSGVIVGDSARAWLGRNSADVGLAIGTPTSVSGRPVGTLYLISTGGRGYMGGRGGAGGPAMTATPEQDFLARINSSLAIAGLIAAAVALLLGLVVTRHLVKPVRALTVGAGRIASGDLAYRAAVRSRDEIGVLAQSFNSMAASLERSEESRRRLNADIAHELRTPLTIIEGTVDAILDGVFPPEKERLNVIKEQTALLTRLIGDLRDLSLAESGQLKLELRPVNLADLVRRKLSQIEAAASERGIRLEFTAPDTLPEVPVDPARMDQAISNLLTNALRHTPRGGTITAAVAVKERESGRDLLVSVTDTGEGIPAADLPHIFERFYRVDTARSRSAGGTGLGLAIVRQMVEAHGGRVWAESQPGKGSTFYIAIPTRQ